MITIDGSIGEGGGQVLRSALALSVCTQQAFRIDRIRAGRPKPGLMRQHLTAVNAAAAICGGRVQGAAVGSQSLTFEPGTIIPGEYTFSIGSAGSATLVLQTVLPPLLCAASRSSITLEGGTHNPFAPPFDFLEHAFLPLINRMGPNVHSTMERAGFYPAGGGRFVVTIDPAPSLRPLHLRERGEHRQRLACASVAGLPGEIAKRELAVIEKSLGWTGQQLQIRQWPSAWGPGNILTLHIASEHVTEVITGFGIKGVLAESLASETAGQARKYLAEVAPVGQYLADQLMLPIALAAEGSFVTCELSRHASTNADIIAKFLAVRITTEAVCRGQYLIEIRR